MTHQRQSISWKWECIVFTVRHQEGESLEQACMVHGVDVNELVEKLNAHIGE